MSSTSWLGPIKQTAFVTNDIEATAQRWVDVHGVGPWFVYTVDIPDTLSRSIDPAKSTYGISTERLPTN